MTNIMLDLETLGTTPGCALLSLGAVVFSTSTGQLGPEFYSVINRQSCAEAFLFEEQGTVEWWTGQGEDAKVVLLAAEQAVAPHLGEVLSSFSAWITIVAGHPKNAYVYGNGADFDNALLAAAYGAVKLKPGWASYNGRCYRSLKNMHGILGIGQHCPKLVRGGTHHNALDDAKSQALHAIAIMQDLRDRLGINTELVNQ